MKVVWGTRRNTSEPQSTTNFSGSCSALCTMPRLRAKQKTVTLLSPLQVHKNFTGSQKSANYASASEIKPNILFCL